MRDSTEKSQLRVITSTGTWGWEGIEGGFPEEGSSEM